MLRDAVEGPVESRAWFLIDIGLLWVWAGILFGYPGIIIPALLAAFAVLATLVVATVGGLFGHA